MILNKTVDRGRVLINSLPKSGTHLLVKSIEIFGYEEHFKSDGSFDPITKNLNLNRPLLLNYGLAKKALAKEQSIVNPIEYATEKIGIGALTPCYVEPSILRSWLDTIQQGQYIVGHINWTPTLSNILADLHYHHVFIIRDPRAVIASMIPFVLETGSKSIRHFLEADFKPLSPLERLNFLLEGGYAPQADVKIENFATVYRSMLAWQNEPGCLFIRFEDLVGAKGGGSEEKQRDVIKNISAYLGISFDEEIDAKTKEIYDPSTRTFRTGKIDGWKSAMDAASIERLNEYCQPLCEDAGYQL